MVTTSSAYPTPANTSHQHNIGTFLQLSINSQPFQCNTIGYTRTSHSPPSSHNPAIGNRQQISLWTSLLFGMRYMQQQTPLG